MSRGEWTSGNPYSHNECRICGRSYLIGTYSRHVRERAHIEALRARAGSSKPEVEKP